MEFIIISGLSGAGKSKVASFLEDIGFYVVDNMPAPLMPKFAELCMAGPGRYDRVALVTDIRGGQTFDGLFDALHELHRMGCAYKILFVEASVETIIKRYKETRRMHPLSSTSRSLDEAVRQIGRSAPSWPPSASGRSTSLTPRPSPPPSCGGRCCGCSGMGGVPRP